jgi:hypothetical protein
VLAVAVADRRILRGSPATLSYQFQDADGVAAAPAGAATIGVVKADQSDLVAAGTATVGTGSDPRTYALAAVNTLELLTATFTDAGDGSTHEQRIEVVGGYYFSVAAARAAEPSLADTASYDQATVVAARREVEDEAERICARAFVPRFCRDQLDGSGRSALRLTNPDLRQLRSVKVDGVAYSGPQLAAVLPDRSRGELRLPATGTPTTTWPAGVGNVIVEYDYGWDRPPAELVKAAILRLRSRLNMPRSGVPDRAERIVLAEGATYTLSMPGEFQTGIPDVDAVYWRYSNRQRGVPDFPLALPR